uniref:WIZ protein n=2 Tax=Pan TaxID=9596 RepID=G2HIX8_PANTR|nr:WIZ protein [Pan troglodytes]
MPRCLLRGSHAPSVGPAGAWEPPTEPTMPRKSLLAAPKRGLPSWEELRADSCLLPCQGPPKSLRGSGALEGGVGGWDSPPPLLLPLPFHCCFLCIAP